MIRQIVWTAILVCGAATNYALGDTAAVEFNRTLPLAPTDHIILDVTVPQGFVNISYSRSEQITVSATARAMDEKGSLPADFFTASLTVNREDNHVKVQFQPTDKYNGRNLRIAYNIGVPYWLEINSAVENGKQTVAGVMGPVKLVCGNGDIKVTFITKTLEATTGKGNIDVLRVGAGAKVETGSGSIDLKDVGPGSVATVKKGNGRIELDGARGSFVATTDAGELHARGMIFDSWDLNSTSGDIRLLVAAESKFDLDAVTRSGQLMVENEDAGKPRDADERECHQKVNGGGKPVRVHTESGSILIQ